MANLPCLPGIFEGRDVEPEVFPSFEVAVCGPCHLPFREVIGPQVPIGGLP
jgi:hypothetical protein